MSGREAFEEFEAEISVRGGQRDFLQKARKSLIAMLVSMLLSAILMFAFSHIKQINTLRLNIIVALVISVLIIPAIGFCAAIFVAFIKQSALRYQQRLLLCFLYVTASLEILTCLLFVLLILVVRFSG